jgi:lipopolysaccharide transport system permease protein
MLEFSSSPREMLASVWRHRRLIVTLARREVLGRYRGSVFGLAWSFFNPILMLAVYTFVFSVVFRARWSGGGESRTEFAIILFAGLMVFNLFAECVTRAPGLVIANANYVKKVVFPLEVLPVVAVVSALFHGGVSLLVWLVFFGAMFGLPPPTALLLPVVLAPLLAFTLGLSWLLASLGVYLRDVGQVVGIATAALMFLSPIFFPVTALPVDVQPILALNPLSLVIEHVRGVLIFGTLPVPWVYAVQVAVSLAVAWLGFAWFQKTRRGFADVL